MSRYYIYDSVTDSVAEFSKDYVGLAKNIGKGIIGNTKLGMGVRALGAGAVGYGGYKLATRGKRKAAAEPAPVDNSLRGRIRSLVGSAKSKAAGAKASAKRRAGAAYETASASVVRAGLRGNAKQGSRAAKGQYNKMTASARNQYAKLRGRGEQ
jgi:hypothetical protein